MIFLFQRVRLYLKKVSINLHIKCLRMQKHLSHQGRVFLEKELKPRTLKSQQGGGIYLIRFQDLP